MANAETRLHRAALTVPTRSGWRDGLRPDLGSRNGDQLTQRCPTLSEVFALGKTEGVKEGAPQRPPVSPVWRQGF